MGDAKGFDEFYAARASQLVRNIYLSTGDLTRAQDCVQEAFVRAWLRWDSLHSSDPVGWVTTVAWRLAIKDWRRLTRELASYIRSGAPAEVGPPSADVVATQQALAVLPVKQRTALVLFYFEDLPISTIATVLDLPEGTVKSQLARGRDALKELISPGTGAR